MANTSISNAFERMWQHTLVALGNKVSFSEAQTLTEEQKEQARANIGALPRVLTSEYFGNELPAAGTAGRVFFKKVSG